MHGRGVNGLSWSRAGVMIDGPHRGLQMAVIISTTYLVVVTWVLFTLQGKYVYFSTLALFASTSTLVDIVTTLTHRFTFSIILAFSIHYVFHEGGI